MKTIKIDVKDAAQAAHVLRLRAKELREQATQACGAEKLVRSMADRLDRVADALFPEVDTKGPIVHVRVGGDQS